MLKVRIRGVNRTVRNLASTDDRVHDAARKGCNEAALYLAAKVKDKFGKYNPTGGDPGGYGSWAKLKLDTHIKKVQKYGHDSGPLIASGKTVGSIGVKKGGKGTLAASVSIASDYIIHHVYGAPGGHVPMRDPIRVTAKEESDACHDIVMGYIDKALRSSSL